MGWDFSCLFRYPGPDTVQAQILALDSRWPPELVTARDALTKAGLDTKRGPEDRGQWRAWDGTEVARPALPAPRAWLRTPQDFLLVFGKDAVQVYHTLRWGIFLTTPELQAPMLDACRALMRELQGRDAVITRDESPILQAFHSGATYDECLTARQDEPAVSRIGDLYAKVPGGWDSVGYWRLPD